MKRIIVALGCVVAVCGCKAMVNAALEPDEPFDAYTPPPEPDYALLDAWAAHPSKANPSSAVPPGEKDTQTDADFDVFFVHPTTYFSDSSWNAALDHQASKDGVDEKVLPNQASVFNATARVFAPRYRQATLGSFTTESLDERAKALNLAYSDVSRAFRYYLEHENQGRPFFLASHSQGSQHLSRMMHEFFVDQPLRNQLVAAYIVGTPVSVRALNTTWRGVPLCSTPEQTGCIVNYNTIKLGADRTRFFEKSYTWLPGQGYVLNQGAGLVCVNPISFRTDDALAPPAAHQGAWRVGRDNVDTKYTSAQCIDGLLEANPANRDYDLLLSRSGDYHLVDYSLFYLDLRRNVERRAQAWRAGQNAHE